MLDHRAYDNIGYINDQHRFVIAEIESRENAIMFSSFNTQLDVSQFSSVWNGIYHMGNWLKVTAYLIIRNNMRLSVIVTVPNGCVDMLGINSRPIYQSPNITHYLIAEEAASGVMSLSERSGYIQIGNSVHSFQVEVKPRFSYSLPLVYSNVLNEITSRVTPQTIITNQFIRSVHDPDSKIPLYQDRVPEDVNAMNSGEIRIEDVFADEVDSDYPYKIISTDGRFDPRKVIKIYSNQYTTTAILDSNQNMWIAEDIENVPDHGVSSEMLEDDFLTLLAVFRESGVIDMIADDDLGTSLMKADGLHYHINHQESSNGVLMGVYVPNDPTDRHIIIPEARYLAGVHTGVRF